MIGAPNLESLSQQRLAALEALKRALLHKAFTGQLAAKSTHRKLSEAAT